VVAPRIRRPFSPLWFCTNTGTRDFAGDLTSTRLGPLSGRVALSQAERLAIIRPSPVASRLPLPEGED
jgi:hypothetical protein